MQTPMFQPLFILGFIANFCFSYETLSIRNVSEPESNAPLDYTLAYKTSRLYGYNGESKFLTHSFIPTSCGANLSVYHTNPDIFPNGGSKEVPILLLNHGYPESSYIWRQVTPLISKRVPVFVPDRPGYGLSTPCTNGSDQFTFSSSILEAANIVYGDNIHVILGGHDRGARTMHRAAVSIDQFPKVNALGVFLADIVPIVEEYASFSNPNYTVGYFHWAFLPRGSFATNVIMAYGGGNFITYVNQLGSGTNSTAIALFEAGDSFAVYANFFNQLSVTNTSVYDYVAGATVDYEAEEADQMANRKVSIPIHIMYSYYNLVERSGFNVSEIWSNWVAPGIPLTTGPVCCGQGHFIIEEAPQQTVDQLNEFMDSLGVAS